MLKFTALIAFSLASFGVAVAGSAGDGKLDGCDSALIEHVRDPLARILDHLTPSERLLAELDNETNIDPYVFVNNNPIQVNMMLMSAPMVPSPTMSTAAETATSGTDDFIQGDAVIDAFEHEPVIAPATDGICEPVGKDCDVKACIATDKILCYMGTDFQCHWKRQEQPGGSGTMSAACNGCYCRMK